MNLKEKLVSIQHDLKAPKNLYNSYGGYKYRNAEGILESVKPFLKKHNVTLTVSDDIVNVGDRYYIKATVKVIDNESDDSIETTALARECETKKGMDASQITGTASSYARKYALNGLFLLDDTKDADTDENRIESQARYETSKAKETQTKEEKAMQDLANMKISTIKVNSLIQRCEKDGVDQNTIAKYYKVKDITQLTESQYADMANNWSKRFKK